VEISPESIIRVDMNRSWMWQDWKINRIESEPFFRGSGLCFWRMETLSRLLF
jgi:hypothetical protein